MIVFDKILMTDFLAIFISFGIALLLGFIIIPILTKEKVDQTEREYIESHKKKNGTPTMGGIIFLIPMIVLGIIACSKEPSGIPVLILVIGFGLIGFLDDFLKVVLKRTDGLKARQKFSLQFIVATIFIVFLKYYSTVSPGSIVPFNSFSFLDFSNLAVAFVFYYLCILGTVNGVNFTDGLDGLNTTVTIVVSLFLLFACRGLMQGNGSSTEIIIAITIGALFAFLMFNAYPAKIFMGDTGSLALGGFVAGIACVLQIPLFIIIFGFIYLLEVVSVILQVLSFKLTGKRIFKMAPIHHHFELCGWSEVKVVAVFSIITALLCVLSYMGLMI
jgi:phospho-N-acetylmuramoyl-pentapeptide-transferase